MAYDTLVLAQHNAVLTITVHRPEVLNAQSRIMREEFDDALAQAAEDDSIRVLIVAGLASIFRLDTISSHRA
jgi:enoyl-CoA hydratase/carnithine racemase